jgi:hypothetical protein
MRWMTSSVMAWSSAERGAVTYVGEPTYAASLPGCANAVTDNVAAANNRVNLFIETSIRLLNCGF